MNDDSHVVRSAEACGTPARPASHWSRSPRSRAPRAPRPKLADLRTYELPPFDPDERDAGDAAEIKRSVSGADAVVLGTPNYHGSYSAPLKNALDYCDRDEFEATTVGLLVVAGGEFPTPALEHLRTVARTLSAWTLPTQVAIPSAYSLVDGGEISDPDLAERVETLGKQLAAYAGVERYPDASATGSVTVD